MVWAEIWKGGLYRVVGDPNSRKKESPHVPT